MQLYYMIKFVFKQKSLLHTKVKISIKKLVKMKKSSSVYGKLISFPAKCVRQSKYPLFLAPAFLLCKRKVITRVNVTMQ